MPTFDAIVEELKKGSQASVADQLRKKYIAKFSEVSGRNVIAYYSGWLQKTSLSRRGFDGFGINDIDLHSFMSVLNGMDRSKGLDLILHTPGGDPYALEGIVNYLGNCFGSDIRAFVPQMAMSAGTMLCLSCREIVMGRHSSLGPIDPQIGNMPADSVLAQFEEAKAAILENDRNILIYGKCLEEYPPVVLIEIRNAVQLSIDLSRSWLENNMFAGELVKDRAAASAKIEGIVNYLASHENTKTHARHISANKAKELGLNIVELESLRPTDAESLENAGMQDALLSLHHAFILSFQVAPAVKIVENQLGKSVVTNVQLME
ncbi:MAG: serine protease [Cyanobacteria bacterium DS3.002]|nr:serine protease [Cyanobacteria bacterium DS3.002]MBA4049521.1 serine protease [Cyanobacteria bacterium DS2.008]